MTSKELKEKLEFHYKSFDQTCISPDPLEYLHRYSNFNDIEISGIISSVFAYGNIRQIMASIEKLHSIMNHQPQRFILNFEIKKEKKYLTEFKHRFYTSEDIIKLFAALNKICSNYNSLKNFFFSECYDRNMPIKYSISTFSKKILSIISYDGNISHGIKFMFPDPQKGSACKRMNLFLRWMVRKDKLDFGLWYEIPTSKLIIPVDTHIAKICKKLRLTNIKNVSWRMAEEITNNLKKYDAVDPVKYDFALCHIGMRKLKF